MKLSELVEYCALACRVESAALIVVSETGPRVIHPHGEFATDARVCVSALRTVLNADVPIDGSQAGSLFDPPLPQQSWLATAVDTGSDELHVALAIVADGTIGFDATQRRLITLSASMIADQFERFVVDLQREPDIELEASSNGRSGLPVDAPWERTMRQHALETIAEGFVALDRDLCFRYLNTSAERLMGVDRTNLIGQRAVDIFPPAPETLEAFERANRDGRSTTLHDYSETLGAWLETRVLPSDSGITIYLRDVTENYEQREALRRSEERFRLISNATNDVLWEWDLVEDVVHWGASIEKLTGYTPDELSSPACWTKVVHPDDLEFMASEILEIREGRPDSWEEEYRVLHADGHERVVAVRGEMVLDDNRRPIQFIGGLTDITERKMLQTRIMRADRLETLGRLSSGVAHDLNNLLTPIFFSLEMLREGEEDADRLEDIETIQKSADRGAEMIRRLLNYARGDEGETKDVHLGEMARDVRKLLARSFPDSVDFQVDIADDVPHVSCDPSQMHQVLTNLCVNARDAMPDGGFLSLAVDAVDVGRCSKDRHELPDGRYVRVCVRDTGVGIPPDKLSSIFEPFYTTKPKGEGTGLGLATVETIITSHGGSIKVESTTETTFEILLPAVP